MQGVRPAHSAKSSTRVHFASARRIPVRTRSSVQSLVTRPDFPRASNSMWSKIAIAGALLVMGGVLSSSVVDNFAYVDRSLPVAMPKAKAFQVKQEWGSQEEGVFSSGSRLAVSIRQFLEQEPRALHSAAGISTGQPATLACVWATSWPQVGNSWCRSSSRCTRWEATSLPIGTIRALNFNLDIFFFLLT